MSQDSPCVSIDVAATESYFRALRRQKLGYSIQVEEAVLQKVLQGNKPHHEIATEYGIGLSTIGKWLRQYKSNGNISLESKGKRPKDRTSEEHVSALIKM